MTVGDKQGYPDACKQADFTWVFQQQPEQDHQQQGRCQEQKQGADHHTNLNLTAVSRQQSQGRIC